MDTTTNVPSTPSDHEAVLFAQVAALDDVKRRYVALELSLLKFFDIRAEHLSAALAALAGCYGVILDEPLEMDDKTGVYPVVARAPGRSDALTAFAAVVAQHGETDRPFSSGVLAPDSSWFRMHHYHVERIVRQDAAARGFQARSSHVGGSRASVKEA